MSDKPAPKPREYAIKFDPSEPNRGWIYPTNHLRNESMNGVVVERSALTQANAEIAQLRMEIEELKNAATK